MPEGALAADPATYVQSLVQAHQLDHRTSHCTAPPNEIEIYTCPWNAEIFTQ